MHGRSSTVFGLEALCTAVSRSAKRFAGPPPSSSWPTERREVVMAPTRRAKPRGQPQSGQTEHQSLLALKKEAWHLRICERRSAAGAVEDLEYAIDEATVEAFSKEVEALRLSLGLHWTWFQEELASGSYDGHLEGEDVLPPPLEAYHEDTISLAKLCKTRRSPPLSTRSSSASTHAPSPGSAPRSPPMQGAQKICIPQEVWLAAERHRKSNFFAAALWQSSVPQLQLSWILTFVEVCEVLDLALSSTAFAGALLGRGCEEELWRCLGARATGGEAVERLPFAGDPSFRACTWLRRQRFFQRVGRGQGVASVVGPVSQLGGPGTRLGPFLPSADSQCGRLVVSDHQTSRVLDVERRRREQVEIDRYNSRRLLLSSLELHPVEVTTSWPLEDAAHCCAGGGMVAAKPLKGVACGTALQWLELPDFEQNGETEACRALARTSLRQEQLAAALEVTSSSLVIESTWPLPQNQVLLLVRDLPATNAGEKKHREVMPDALGATGAERLEASGRWWLQVWSLDAHRKEFQPRAKAQLKWKVTCVDCADLKGELLLLCGGERHAELFDLRTLSSIGRWEVSHAVKHVLLREAHEANEAIAILGQETAVLVATKESVHAVLPHKAFDALAVEALQPVGTRGFAVCSRRHVYAFEVNGDGAQLMATVELPNGDGKVEHFFASPYEFFVVIRREKRAKPRAISCLWPHRGEAKATGAYAVSLKAWAGEQLSETSAVAVDLKFLLTGGPIETLSYHCAPLGTRGQDLLAVSAVGGGVAVVRWGMEVNPAVDFIREMREAKLAQQEEEHQREVWRRQLQRLQQRLQETEKLEEKASRQEALTSEETAKVGRRPQVEAEIERLIHELGLDHHSEEEESEADPEEERSAALAERRRAKERVQRQHHEEKRAMQKERQRNRDRKFS